MSTGSSNTIYVKDGDQIVRQAEHACYCDLCRLMDKIDNKVLELTKPYLEEKIDFDTWFDSLMGETNSDDEIALNRFDMHFESGPVNLKHTIEHIVWLEYQPDPWGNRHLVTEHELRLRLSGVICGYENRQRTKQLWKKDYSPLPKM